MIVEINVDGVITAYDSDDNTVFFEINGQHSDSYDRLDAIAMLKQITRTLESLP